MTLRGLLEAYRSTPCYSDAGSVLFRQSDGSWRLARRFTTSFSRGERLSLRVQLLECGMEDDAAVVVIEGAAVADADSILRLPGGRQRCLPLSAALAAASGVTSAVSWLVPSLLLNLPAGVQWFEGLLCGVNGAVDAETRVLASPGGVTVALVDQETGFLRSFETTMSPPGEAGVRQRIEFEVLRSAPVN